MCLAIKEKKNNIIHLSIWLKTVITRIYLDEVDKLDDVDIDDDVDTELEVDTLQ